MGEGVLDQKLLSFRGQIKLAQTQIGLLLSLDSSFSSRSAFAFYLELYKTYQWRGGKWTHIAKQLLKDWRLRIKTTRSMKTVYHFFFMSRIM